jgi:hypothetical protein
MGAQGHQSLSLSSRLYFLLETAFGESWHLPASKGREGQEGHGFRMVLTPALHALLTHAGFPEEGWTQLHPGRARPGCPTPWYHFPIWKPTMLSKQLSPSQPLTTQATSPPSYFPFLAKCICLAFLPWWPRGLCAHYPGPSLPRATLQSVCFPALKYPWHSRSCPPPMPCRLLLVRGWLLLTCSYMPPPGLGFTTWQHPVCTLETQ